MGVVYGKYWKTNKQDIERFALVCSTVLKHPDRTNEELYAIAETYDDLMAGRDVVNDLRSIVVRKYQSITERRFPLTTNNSYQNPWDVGANKGQVFKEALLDRGIDIENFDPHQKWSLEPGVDTPIKKIDLKKIVGSRGAAKTRGQSSRSAIYNARIRSLAIKQASGEKRNEGRQSVTKSKQFAARIKKRIEANQSA